MISERMRRTLIFRSGDGNFEMDAEGGYVGGEGVKINGKGVCANGGLGLGSIGFS